MEARAVQQEETLAEEVAGKVGELEAELDEQTRAHADFTVNVANLKDLIRNAETRLREYRRELEVMPAPSGVDSKTGVDTFLALTLRNVMGSITDLEQLGRALAGQTDGSPHPCQLINCPRGAQLQTAVEDTIAVLEETKGAFKSKTLADLRHRLELLVKHV